MEKNCVFCKIGKGEIPSLKVYENKNFLAFLDISPVAKGHTLIIPKEHIIWMQEADNKTIEDIFKLAKKLMLAIKMGLNCDYVKLSIVGKDIPHFHIHLIPSYIKEKIKKERKVVKYEMKEKEIIIKKIVSVLAHP